MIATIGALVAALAAPAPAPPRYEPRWESLDRRPIPPWFQKARFGVFVCWGPYSVPAWAPRGQYAEWYGYQIRQPGSPHAAHHEATYGKDFPYERFAERMTGAAFQPDAWADLFARSGARYVVMAANYHDGFCLWPSPFAPGWNALDTGPRRDALGEAAEAVRRRGLRFGIYYSLYEWFHPLWLSDRRRYVAEHFHPQFRDVVTRYRPHVIFADGEWEADDRLWRSEELLAWLFNESPVRREVVVNDRWGASRGKHGSFFESEYGGGEMAPAHPWQEDRGIGKSYGLNRNETEADYDSVGELVRMLSRCAGNGGNLLLCVGPEADGSIPAVMQDRLLGVGAWLQENGEAIYGTSASPFWPRRFAWGTCTARRGRLYAHVWERPGDWLELPGLRNRVRAARLLGARRGAALRLERGERGPQVALPPARADGLPTIVALDLDGSPRVDRAVTPAADGTVTLRAAEALIAGGSPRFERRHPEGNIGFWNDPADTVSWRIRLSAPAVYEVTLLSAVDAGAGGSAFVVEAGEERLDSETVETGSWGRFEERVLGRLRLPAGELTLTVRPRTPPVWHSMGLARIDLRPAR